MTPKVTAVVLNYKGKQDSLECLRSLSASDYPALEIMFVDNASGDNSIEEVRRVFPTVKTLQNGGNLGYAGGNNRGIRESLQGGAEYVFVLNNDTALEKNTVRMLVDAAGKDTRAGILAPRVMDFEDRKVIHSCGTDMDWFKLRPKEGLFGKEWKAGMLLPAQPSVYPGSALLLKKDMLNVTGGFDERYFLVHEDADLCFRAAKSGFAVRSVPEAVVYHKLSKALSSNPFLSAYYTSRNFLHLALRHANLFQSVACALGVAVFSILNGMRSIFLTGSRKETAKGFVRGVQGFFRGETGAYNP